MKTIFGMVRNVPRYVYMFNILMFAVIGYIYASRCEVNMGSLVLMFFLFMVWTVLSVLMFQPTDDSCGLSRLLDCRVKFIYLGRKYDVIYHLDAGWLRSKAVVRQCVLEMVFETHPNAVIESCEII